MDLFSLYVLFSHFRPRDVPKGIPFCFYMSYAYICTCRRRHLKESVPWSNITWSEMGKQNVQAKEVHCALGHLKQRKFKLCCFVLDVLVRNLLSSMAVFVPCDRQLQKAHLSEDDKTNICRSTLMPSFVKLSKDLLKTTTTEIMPGIFLS